MAARDLQGSVNQFIANPTAKNLKAARAAWRVARVPYQQSEVYRFGNAIVDDWEGKVNAWPLDEGLIDYVAASYGADSEEIRRSRAHSSAGWRRAPCRATGEQSVPGVRPSCPTEANHPYRTVVNEVSRGF